MELKNQFIQLPEFTILSLLRLAINFIRTDLAEQVEEQDSYLYYLTKGVGLDRIDIFKQAKRLFLITDPEDPKYLDISLGWPQDKKGALSCVINHAGEQQADNVLGVDQSEEVYAEYINVDQETEESDAYRNTYGRRFSSKYQIIISGDNTNETIIVYTILKSILISFMGTGHLDYMGFQNVQLSGNDLQLRSDVTKPLFAKVLNLQFEYMFAAPDTNRLKYINGIIFNQILLDK